MMNIVCTWFLLGFIGLLLMYTHRAIEDKQGPIWTYKNHGLKAMWRGSMLALLIGPFCIALYLYLQYIKYVRR